MSNQQKKRARPEKVVDEWAPTFEPISPAIIGQREKFLLYGPPKMGKTFCALTLPGPILFLAIGGNNEAKTFYSKDFQEKHPGVKVTVVEIKEDVGRKGIVKEPKGFDRACLALDIALEKNLKGELDFNAIIVDNATILSEYQMHKVLKISHTSSSGETAYDKYTKQGILTPFDSDWGAAQSLMKKFITWLFEIDKHIALVAHEYHDMVTNRATQSREVVGIKPSFVGRDRDIVANKFDNVWHFRRQGQHYVARTTPESSPDVIAGTRVGGLIKENYSNPNLTEAINVLAAHAQKVG